MNLACCVHELEGLVLLNVYTSLSLLIFSAIAMRVPMIFIIEIKAAILKFVSKHKRFTIAKAILSQMSKTGGIALLTSKYITKL